MRGLWLIIAPFVLDYSNIHDPFLNDIIIGILGIILTGLCVLTASNPDTTQARLAAGGLAILASVWLIIAPVILNYFGISSGLWNDIISGILFIVIGDYGVRLNRGGLLLWLKHLRYLLSCIVIVKIVRLSLPCK